MENQVLKVKKSKLHNRVSIKQLIKKSLEQQILDSKKRKFLMARALRPLKTDPNAQLGPVVEPELQSSSFENLATPNFTAGTIVTLGNCDYTKLGNRRKIANFIMLMKTMIF
jgi:hypothetical protein